MRAYVTLFRAPGYPPIKDEIDAVLDRAWQRIESADDPVETALDLAAAMEIATHAVRDFAADLIVERAQAVCTRSQLGNTPAPRDDRWAS